jgi:hypothetical protein
MSGGHLKWVDVKQLSLKMGWNNNIFLYMVMNVGSLTRGATECFDQTNDEVINCERSVLYFEAIK